LPASASPAEAEYRFHRAQLGIQINNPGQNLVIAVSAKTSDDADAKDDLEVVSSAPPAFDRELETTLRQSIDRVGRAKDGQWTEHGGPALQPAPRWWRDNDSGNRQLNCRPYVHALRHGRGHITGSLPIGLNLDTVLSEAERVIHANGAQIFERKHCVEIDCWWLPINNDIVFRRHGKASVIAGQELTQHGIGLMQVGDTMQAEFTDEAVLKGTKQSFNPSFRLWRMRGDRLDVQLPQQSSKLRAIGLSIELVGDRQLSISAALEDPVTVPIYRHRAAIFFHDHSDQ